MTPPQRSTSRWRTPERTTVVVLDRLPLFRLGVASALAKSRNLTIVGTAASGHEALQVIDDVDPDIVLTEQQLVDMTLPQAVRRIRDRRPATRLVAMTGAYVEPSVKRLVPHHLHGIVAKAAEPPVLVRALRAVAAGEVFVDPHLELGVGPSDLRRAPGTPYGLTMQQLRVLEHLPLGLTNRQIAERLGVEVSTVKTHVRIAMEKLDVSTRAHAAAVVVREGLSA